MVRQYSLEMALLLSLVLILSSVDAGVIRKRHLLRDTAPLGVACVTAEHDVGQPALDIMRNFTESIGGELEMSSKRRQKLLCLMAKLLKGDAERQQKALLGVYR